MAPPAEASRPAPARVAEPERAPAPRAIDLDWSAIALASEADALALWRRIAPTGDAWELQLGEIPPAFAAPLAIALLRGGNFTCTRAPTGPCAAPVYDVAEPAATAGFDDPCLRRLLALWAIAQLEDDDLAPVTDALRAIAALPPPESELVAAALQAPPERAQDLRLELAAIAWRAGQHEVVATAIGALDEAHLIEAVTRHKLDPALDVLSATGHRDVYLKAVLDEALGTRARTQAIAELLEAADPLPPDLVAVLVRAAASPDCAVAATAARLLEAHGDARFVPKPPRSRAPAAMVRALCVLASYEQQQRPDERSRLAAFVPKAGLERVTVAYDPLGDTDTDGDGDPHVERTAERLTGDALVLPELDDLVRALRRCRGTVCATAEREYRFRFAPAGRGLALTRIEIIERPPCPRPAP